MVPAALDPSRAGGRKGCRRRAPRLPERHGVFCGTRVPEVEPAPPSCGILRPQSLRTLPIANQVTGVRTLSESLIASGSEGAVVADAELPAEPLEAAVTLTVRYEVVPPAVEPMVRVRALSPPAGTPVAIANGMFPAKSG